VSQESADESVLPAPPEAALLRRRRDQFRISPEQLSKMIKARGSNLSGRRIRELEIGYSTKDGQPTSARADTLADFAMVLGILPEHLEEVGRHDAAMVLRDRVEERAEQEPAVAALASERVRDSHLESAHIMQVVFQGLDDIRAQGHLSHVQREELERAYLQSLRRGAEASHEQLLASLRAMRYDAG
jgi:hypothetical protein